jgi:hypothetical protein
MKVKLSDIVEVLQMPFEEDRFYLDLNTGEVLAILEEEFEAAGSGNPVESFPDWEQGPVAMAREVLGAPENFLEIPSGGRETELEIMERFRLSLDDPLAAEALRDAAGGDNAFREFKNVLFKFSLEKRWFPFRNGQFAAMAAKWCRENDIECETD